MLLCWEKLWGVLPPATGLHDGSDVSWELRLKSAILGPRRSLIFEPARFGGAGFARNTLTSIQGNFSR
ncbi:hypothetical protein KCP78_08365 [Salmonella enterica subsp. enterica]|nr:hypothetical protein KCP78_08365 [Salmonella enterica subsp. enterica]